MGFPVFRVVYSTTFIILLLLVLALLLVSPADGIYQSRVNQQEWNIVVIAAVYLLTLLIAIFIYATRMYTTHTHLNSIPRSYIPIRKGDVSLAVFRLITESLEKSARIAYQVHPRDLSKGAAPDNEEALDERTKEEQAAAQTTPTWGNVAHPGWSSATATDLPGLQYEPVILELANIVEAKAVSLAPPDLLATSLPADDSPSAEPSSSSPVAPPDPTAVALLQRRPATSLRAYLAQLSNLDMIHPTSFATEFLAHYEPARFSGLSLEEPAFHALLSSFTALLASLRPPDPERIAREAARASPTPTSSSHRSSSPRPSVSTTSTGTTTAGSVVHHRHVRPMVHGVDGTATMSPALTTAGATPFLTPETAYPASLSSGHAGDRSDDTEDDAASTGSERTAHTAWTRPSAARSAPSGSRRRISARRRDEARERHEGHEERKDQEKELKGSEESESGGSVVVRRDAAGQIRSLVLPAELLASGRASAFASGVEGSA